MKCFRSVWDKHKKIHERKIDIINVLHPKIHQQRTKKYLSETIKELIPELKKHRKETDESMNTGVELYMEGQKVFNQHDFITAETKLRKHFKKAPFFGSYMLAHPNAFYMLGQIYHMSSVRMREAAAYLEKGAQTATRMLCS